MPLWSVDRCSRVCGIISVSLCVCVQEAVKASFFFLAAVLQEHNKVPCVRGFSVHVCVGVDRASKPLCVHAAAAAVADVCVRVRVCVLQEVNSLKQQLADRLTHEQVCVCVCACHVYD
jgi:hypothetical protein